MDKFAPRKKLRLEKCLSIVENKIKSVEKKQLRFVINSKPKAKARPRFKFNKSTNSVVCYSPRSTTDFEKQVWLECLAVRCAQKITIFEKAVKVVLEIYVQPTKKQKITGVDQAKSTEVIPIQRPDIDNVAKAILDGLVGAAFYDDSQVSDLIITRRYGERAHMIVTIEEV